MAFLLLGVKTKIGWINDIAKTPILGDFFLFVVMFVPAVLLSFLAQAIIPALQDDVGFTKAMLLLLPSWNLLLWLSKIKCYLFAIPSWIILGVIALVKLILLVVGIDDGQ